MVLQIRQPPSPLVAGRTTTTLPTNTMSNTTTTINSGSMNSSSNNHRNSTNYNYRLRSKGKHNNARTTIKQSWLPSISSVSLSSSRLLPVLLSVVRNIIRASKTVYCCLKYITIVLMVPILFFRLGVRHQSQQQQQDCQYCHQQLRLLQIQLSASSSSSSLSSMLTPPNELEQLVVAMAHTSKQDFMTTFDLGVPFDSTTTSSNTTASHTDDVLFIYNIKTTIPNRIVQLQQDTTQQQMIDNDNTTRNTATSSSSSDTTNTIMIPSLPIHEVMENCDVINVMITSSAQTTRNVQQCTAIVPHYENSHIMKFMRMKTRQPLNYMEQLLQAATYEEEERVRNMLYPSTSNDINKDHDDSEFRLVATTHKPNGRIDFRIPNLQDETLIFWKVLQNYFQHVPIVRSELQNIISTQMQIRDRIPVSDLSSPDDNNYNSYYMDNTVIVMVCNYGQSELLINFVCAARRHIHLQSALDHILIFTTDIETTNIVAALGLHYYYDERNFGSTPKDAADHYGDTNFVAMMMAKVICVQLVSMLGYNILFQDVDMIWYQHPLQYFDKHQVDMNQYDIIFQDDGGRSVRYAPYSANTGFYYVRYNDRTRHFLTSLLMAGDVIISTHSHQQVMIALLKEHVSLFGLKVKVLSRDMEEFPGGFHYHQRSKEYMKNLFAGVVKPYIFHMSWTLNKDNKILFFRQMGEWYVNEKCIQTPVDAKTLNGNDADNSFVSNCCSKEPLVSCHYRDKPSIQPCKRSPSIDKNRASWW